MKNYRWGVLIISSFVLLFESCSSVHHQGYRQETAIDYTFNPVFGSGFDKSMYSAEIIFGDNIFTSLVIFKYISVRNSYRMAFLSESGISLFEMEFFDNGEANVHFISDFLNKKAIVNKLLSDFSLLFPIVTNNNITKRFSKKEDTGSYIIRIKRNGIKDYYFSSDNQGPIKIGEHGFIYGRTLVFLDQYENNCPSEIKITHRMINFQINLKQISYSEWN